LCLATDLGGAFNLHRELELVSSTGLSPAELLNLAAMIMCGISWFIQTAGALKQANLLISLVAGNPVEISKPIKPLV